MDKPLEILAAEAQNDDKDTLRVVVAIQDDIHRLSVRMLFDCEAARDATQEILIRIITKLSTFRFESAFRTWAWRIATNYLLTAKRDRVTDPAGNYVCRP